VVYETHEIADSFSQLSEEEYQALVADIHQYGLREPITLFEGRILDGRHRYNSLMDLQDRGVEVEPRFFTFEGTYAEAEAYAESLNVHRRHLLYEQRVCRAALYKKAHSRQGERTDLTSTEIGGSRGETAELAAVKYGVGKTAVREAESILDTEPDLFDYLQTQLPCPENEGKPLSLRDAQRIVTKRKKEREAEQARQAEEALYAELDQRPDVQTGQWWQLGEHRLYCGDSSSKDFYCTLPEVPFAFADPPYNAEVAAWDRDFQWRHDWLMDYAKVVAVTPGIASIFSFARITKMPYLWSAACYINNGMTRGAMGFGNWIYTALFSHKSLHRNSQDYCEVSISTAKTDETDHKGRKPSGLLIWLLNRFSEEGDTVIDPFLGSGTTLFAADKAGRKCIGAEINPEYCTEIILRWQRMTKEKAVLLNGKNTL
jgi:DNA modification methylase